jgi:hypothetical protein
LRDCAFDEFVHADEEVLVLVDFVEDVLSHPVSLLLLKGRSMEVDPVISSSIAYTAGPTVRQTILKNNITN